MTTEEKREIMGNRSGNSRLWTGLMLLAAGGLLMMQRMGAPVPYWIFSWQFLLMALGAFIGLRRGFRGGAWMAMILIGGIFFAGMFFPEWELRHYTGPVILMIIGLVFILRPRRHRLDFRNHARWTHGRWSYQGEQSATYQDETTASDDRLDVVSVFGGTKKKITSKDFKGGEVTSFLGGTELDLSQADIKGKVVLELTQVLGGTKLIVPSHWDVKPELVTIFGGMEDKRQLTGIIDPDKILLLKGTSVFGGIEIRSY